ncbi:MAG: bacteriochlorophyll 4-vinyl reductase [Pseudomonadota bacterium]
MDGTATWQPTTPIVGDCSSDHPGRIGPNAVLQVFNALEERQGAQEVTRLAKLAGLTHYREQAPATMVDERDVVALHRAVRSRMTVNEGDQVLWRAGERTADYILANRIPKAVQVLLRALPAKPASRLLLKAIAKNAWTFAGSGTFAFTAGKPATLTLADCPACTEVYRQDERCLYYAATLQGLFQALVHPRARIEDDLSPTTNGRVRRFVLDWPS